MKHSINRANDERPKTRKMAKGAQTGMYGKGKGSAHHTHAANNKAHGTPMGFNAPDHYQQGPCPKGEKHC